MAKIAWSKRKLNHSVFMVLLFGKERPRVQHRFRVGKECI